MSAGAALQYSRSAGRQQRLAIDGVTVGAVFSLLLVGLVMVGSASVNVAERLTGDPFFHFERQLFSALLGCTFAAAVLAVPVAAWKRFAPWLLVASMVLLVLVLVPHVGKSVNGSRRWLSLGIVNVQPSEFMKLAVVLYAASYAVRRAAFLHAEQPLTNAVALLAANPPFAAPLAIAGAVRAEDALARAQTSGLAPITIDPEYENSLVRSWTTEISQSLPGHVTVSATYVGSRGEQDSSSELVDEEDQRKPDGQ